MPMPRTRRGSRWVGQYSEKTFQNSQKQPMCTVAGLYLERNTSGGTGAVLRRGASLLISCLVSSPPGSRRVEAPARSVGKRCQSWGSTCSGIFQTDRKHLFHPNARDSPLVLDGPLVTITGTHRNPCQPQAIPTEPAKPNTHTRSLLLFCNVAHQHLFI